MERVQNPGTLAFFPGFFLVPKKNGKLHLIIDLSLLNRYIEKQDGDIQVCKTIDGTQRLGYLHRSDRCIPSRSDTSSVQKVFLRQCAISVLTYLDDWLIKDLIRNRLISQTKCFIQTIHSLGFLPNLKKSELLPSQKVTFIGMEFQTQQKLVRVPMDRVENLVLTIRSILSCKKASALTFLSLLDKLSTIADFVLLGRLHLHPLQMCLLSVWRPHILPLDHPIPITGMIRYHLQWWMNTNRFEIGTPIHPPDPNIYLYTDASHFGWRANLSFHGRWTED